MAPILEVSNLRTYFHGKDGTVPAVDGVNFSLDAGKTLGVVGESGCGKSITALSVLQLLPSRSARIEPGSLQPHRVAYRAQNTSLYTG